MIFNKPAFTEFMYLSTHSSKLNWPNNFFSWRWNKLSNAKYGFTVVAPTPIKVATLIGVGATTVNPYLAFDSLFQRHEKKLFGQFSFDECVERYINSVNAGLLKIMSKMGISVLSSYRGGCNFETVGLSRTIVATIVLLKPTVSKLHPPL